MRRRRLAVACAAALLAGAAAGAADLGRLRPGVFLYAAPSLRDPNFSETVVLLVKHGPEGAMGLIINRPTQDRAAEALPGVRLAELRLYRGGPVQPEAILALVRGKPPQKAERVLDGVFLSGRREDLEAAARDGRALERVRLYSGYAGWSAGQLEKEWKLGGWVIGPADAAAVFSPEPETLWRKVFRLLQRREARLRPPSLSLVQADAGPLLALPHVVERHRRSQHETGERERQGAFASDAERRQQIEGHRGLLAELGHSTKEPRSLVLAQPRMIWSQADHTSPRCITHPTRPSAESVAPARQRPGPVPPQAGRRPRSAAA